MNRTLLVVVIVLTLLGLSFASASYLAVDGGVLQVQSHDVTFPATATATGQNCTHTPGYWAGNAKAWPVAQLELGRETYDQARLLGILNSPSLSEVSYRLVQPLIAVKLSIAAGADGAAVADTVAVADGWLAAHGADSTVNNAAWKPVGPVVEQLVQYHNGDIGPGLCAGDAPERIAIVPTATPTITPTMSATATITPTAKATGTSAPTETVTPTATGTATQTPTATGTLAPTDTARPTATGTPTTMPTPTPPLPGAGSVRPELLCVAALPDGRHAAFFDYSYNGAAPRTIPEGADNFLAPAGVRGTVPVTFTQQSAGVWPAHSLAATFGGDAVHWEVEGLRASGSADSRACARMLTLRLVWYPLVEAQDGPAPEVTFNASSELGAAVCHAEGNEPGAPQCSYGNEVPQPLPAEQALWVPRGETYRVSIEGLSGPYEVVGAGTFDYDEMRCSSATWPLCEHEVVIVEQAQESTPTPPLPDATVTLSPTRPAPAATATKTPPATATASHTPAATPTAPVPQPSATATATATQAATATATWTPTATAPPPSTATPVPPAVTATATATP